MDKDNQAFPRMADVVTLILNYLHGDDYPEDDWIRISEFWDINLWTENHYGFATIYPVYFGQTDTSRGITWVVKLGVRSVDLWMK